MELGTRLRERAERVGRAREVQERDRRRREEKTDDKVFEVMLNLILRQQEEERLAMDEPRPDEAAESESSASDSSTLDTSDSSVTMPMPEPRRVSERLARKENRF